MDHGQNHRMEIVIARAVSAVTALGRSRCLRLVLMIGALMIGALGVQGEVTTFTLDPNRSSLEVRGTINGFALNMALKEQGAGSLVARYSGKIVAEVTDTTIRFIGGSRIKPFEIANWEPGPFGVEGVAPASYGLLASVHLGTLTVVGKAASRNWQFGLASVELPLQNATFTSRHVRFPFFDTTNSFLDYRFFFSYEPGEGDIIVDGGNSDEEPGTGGSVHAAGGSSITVAGRHVMSPDGSGLTNRATAPSVIVSENGVRTLTIPMDAWYTFTVTNAHHQFRFNLIFGGQLVATDAGIVEHTAPAHPGGPFQLSWPAGYKLQRASKLSPPDWEDFAFESPIEHPTLQPAEYFRAIKSD